MPRHKYKKVSSKPSNDVRNMVDAIKEVTLENRTLRSIAEKYKVGRSRLQRYISRIEAANLDPATVPDEQLFEFVSSLSDRVGGKTIFSVKQEKRFIKYILESDEIQDKLTKKMVKKFAYQFGKKIKVKFPVPWETKCEASDDWYYAFVHRNEMTVKRLEQMKEYREEKQNAAEILLEKGSRRTRESSSDFDEEDSQPIKKVCRGT